MVLGDLEVQAALKAPPCLVLALGRLDPTRQEPLGHLVVQLALKAQQMGQLTPTPLVGSDRMRVRRSLGIHRAHYTSLHLLTDSKVSHW